MRFFIFAFAVLLSTNAFAWGKRGHSITCQTAAYLSADKSSKAEFMKAHSFDLGYYCNVPDLVWKKGNLYEQEWFNHFMDMEIFDRALKGADKKKAFEMSRVDFNSTYPDIKESAGRSFWRIRELLGDADKLKTELQKTNLPQEERQKLQGDWLLHVGTAGHYVGDLSQPLHLTENYDGQKTNQKGIHAWFEDQLVDELFLDNGMGLENDVIAAAQLKMKKLSAKWEKASTLEILTSLSDDSFRELPNLLKLDKKVGRKNSKAAARAFRVMIVDRLATGAVALSILWNRELGWDYDGKKFYFFAAEPAYIAYPKASAFASPTPSPSATPVAAATPAAE